MANYSELLADIATAIYTNNNQEIDALDLKGILVEMVEALGDGYLIKGVAGTSTDPGEPDTNVAYFAYQAGTYTNFDSLSVSQGEVALLLWDGDWHKGVTGMLSTGAIVDNLTTKVLSAKQGKVLKDLISEGYLIAGMAKLTPSQTNPGSISGKVAYIASEPGTYTNFGSLVVNDGEVAILKYNGTWTKEVTGAATAAEVSALGHEVGVYFLNWEYGNISISGSGWVYGGSTTRVRMPQGQTAHLYPGDVIGLTNYTGYRYYFGWRRADSTYGTSGGWKTADFVVTEEGDYVFLLSKSPEAALSDVSELSDLFFIQTGRDNFTLENGIKKLNTDLVNYSFLLTDGTDNSVSVKMNAKYIRYSDGAPIGSGSYFDIYAIPNTGFEKVSIICGYTDGGAAAIAFYNTDTVLASGYMASDSVQGSASHNDYSADVPAGCKLIVITNRNSKVASPTINLYSDVSSVYKKLLSPPPYYRETSIGTGEIRPGSVYTTFDIPAKLAKGDVIKCKIADFVITSGYATIYLVANGNVVDYILPQYSCKKGDEIVWMMRQDADTIRLYQSDKAGFEVEVYKVEASVNYGVLRKDNFIQNSAIRKQERGVFTPAWSQYKVPSYNSDYATTGLRTYREVYSSARFGSGIIYARNPNVKITLTDDTNYRFGIWQIRDIDRLTFYDWGWKTSLEAVLECAAFVVVLDKNGATMTDADIAASGIQIEFLDDYEPTPIARADIDRINNEISVGGIAKKANAPYIKEFVFGNQCCYGHLFINQINGGNPPIPSQSLFDLDATASLGFKYIEANDFGRCADSDTRS